MIHRFRTGGKAAWVFDPTTVEPKIMNDKSMAYTDTYFVEDDKDTDRLIVAMALEHLMSTLPPELEEAVRLLYIGGTTQRGASRMVGVTHVTIKARADKGIALLRDRLDTAVWLVELLRDRLPEDMYMHIPVVTTDTVKSILLSMVKGEDNVPE